MTQIYAIDARATTAHFPGIGRYVRSLLTALVTQLSSQEQIVYLCDARQKERLSLVENQNLIWQRTRSSPFGLRQQLEIPRLLRRSSAAVYHSPYYLMPYWPGVRTVLTVYDVIPLYYPEYVSMRARLLFDLTTRLALKVSTTVIAISQATREDYINRFGVGPERIVTIPLAAASNFRSATQERIERVRHEYSLRRPYVLYIGSNKPHKNLARLLQAWELVVEAFSEPCELVLAGHLKATDDDLARQTAAPGLRQTVRLFHDVADDDLVSLFSGAELFVFPSLYEGFGLPVLEAMACGCAVACSNRSSLREIAGGAAILFNPEAPSDIARSIVELLADEQKRERFQKLAKQRAAAFSWERTAADTLHLYRQMAGQDWK